MSENQGKLQIGDQWNAISIIAHSQTHPLKAVCELTENAIDAHSTEISITRRRKDGEMFLELQDDGDGVRLNDEGLPDFDYLATHICDSMKRYLSGKDKSGVHGEFGIGLLSFWSLGDELRMASAGKDGKVYELVLKRGDDGYEVRTVRGKLNTGGTRIVIGPLLPATRSIVTGEKLDRYLAAELRDRIRATGVTVHIADKIARKDKVVEPREFEGELLELPEKIKTPAGDMFVELYLRPQSGSRDTRIALCKDGTRVLADIAELPQFAKSPWTNDRLEGIIDYPPLNLAPGTRGGVIPDEKLDWFVTAMTDLEEQVNAAVESRQQAASEQASKEIQKQIHKALRNALQTLSRNDYFFFDIPRSPSRPQGGPETVAGKQSVARDFDESESRTLTVAAGKLDYVACRPASVLRQPRQSASLTAIARDENDLQIDSGVTFAWRVIEGNARCEPEGAKCVVTSNRQGRVVVQVTAHQKKVTTTAEVEVRFSNIEIEGETADGKRTLPAYRLEPDQGSRFRSRYDAGKNEIVINSGHRDFLASLASASRHRRYIGKLYAKEVVLINFSHETPGEISERLVEMLVRTEEAL
jgi:hypothetical protein